MSTVKKRVNSRISIIEKQVSDVKDCNKKLSQKLTQREKWKEQHERKVKTKHEEQGLRVNIHPLGVPDWENVKNAEGTILADDIEASKVLDLKKDVCPKI